MKNKAHYDPKTKKATFGQTISHGEVRKGARIVGGGPSAYGQNLASKKGTDGAKKSLLRRYKK